MESKGRRKRNVCVWGGGGEVKGKRRSNKIKVAMQGVRETVSKGGGGNKTIVHRERCHS